jgi:hypothetical protein
MLYVENKNISVGVQNDGEFLYLRLKAVDRTIQQEIMRLGLTVWFDSSANENKTLGIHYPIGVQDYGLRFARGEGEADGNMESRQQQFRQMLGEMEILGPTKIDRNRIPLLNPYGIEAGISDTSGMLAYELKVPLKPTNKHLYAVGADTARFISIGLETGEFRLPAMSRGGGGMSGGGTGMGGGRGGRGGGRGGGMGPGGGQPAQGTSEPMKLWMKVKIASAEVQKP